MQLSEQQEQREEQKKMERALKIAQEDLKAYLKTCSKKELIRAVLDLSHNWRELHDKYNELYDEYMKIAPQPETEAAEASKE